MKAVDFDFFLPPDLIAERPLKERDSSRLLVLHRDSSVEHKHFSDLPLYLNEGDLVLMNNTKVFPARLTGMKKNGGSIEILFVREREKNVWDVLSKGSYTGTLTIARDLTIDLVNGKTAHVHYNGNFTQMVWKYGAMPLPPYIMRAADELDRDHYQTVFAKHEGSIAAPTAGLHFTNKIIKNLMEKGVFIRELTLHVGVGTFRPIKTTFLEDHSMDAEYFELGKGLVQEIKDAKSSGNKVLSIGTTTTRAIEAYMSGRCHVTTNNGIIQGMTDVFIYPGFVFNAVDSLLTNFHLPRSTPLMLTSAKCGRESLMNAYRQAISKRYRFLSYGDAMLIL
jgi:S-adenosylmethionine:tRNA ribosyltransferase-isomerase